MSATAGAARTATPALSPATRRVAWIVSAIFFIEQLDATIIAPALPAMGADLGTDAITLSAAITAYLLGLTVLIPMSGRLAERFGDKAVFTAAIGAFLVSSAACGFAQDAGVLIGLRFVQGLAGALMAPVGRLIVLRAAATHELVEAMALVILLAMIAPMVGPFLGGLLTTYLGWRWIFWINIPLCLGALYLVRRFLPSTAGSRDVRFDVAGATLTGLGFAGLVYGLVVLGERHGGDGGLSTAWFALAAGLVLLAAYGWYARRVAAPVLALGLLRVRSFRDAMAGGSVFRIAVGGVPFLLPLTLQQGYGYSPLAAGLVVLVPAIGGFSMKFFSTRLLRRLGYRTGLLLHGVFAAACLALAGALSPRDALIVYVLALFGFGWARSLQMNAYGTLAYADVEKPRLASATSFFLSIQNLTVALGVALAAVLLRVLEQVPGVDVLHSHLWTYLLLSAAALASALMCLAMPAAAGAHLLAGNKTRS
ncbi:multidrug efflux MFS transporter [Verticiella sediminum]|uniref:Multidrug efflux MFS transporter n=1 Tax=Verticiella sediminum TaxID=1247510 RepID=A0A556ACW2_9BURK|nr:MFS transporter [Verticiella sediminum]TSH90732.1 multidrug efflux MFS transporter [Verticiella sediminum]